MTLDDIDYHKAMVRPCFRDQETGEMAWERYFVEPMSVYFWSNEGNGGCDCNREAAFGHDATNGDPSLDGICLGSRRYIVVDLEGIDDPQVKDQAIAWMNEGYSRD